MLLAAVMTDRVRAEDGRSTNQQQLELALSAARLVSWDWHVKAIGVGRGACGRCSGFPRPEVPGRRPHDGLVHPTIASRAHRRARRSGAGPRQSSSGSSTATATVHWLLSPRHDAVRRARRGDSGWSA
jgi:hypothetical protein